MTSQRRGYNDDVMSTESLLDALRAGEVPSGREPLLDPEKKLELVSAGLVLIL